MSRILGTAERVPVPMQQGDVVETWADTSRLEALTGFTPRTPLDQGLSRTAEWLLGHERLAG